MEHLGNITQMSHAAAQVHSFVIHWIRASLYFCIDIKAMKRNINQELFCFGNRKVDAVGTNGWRVRTFSSLCLTTHCLNSLLMKLYHVIKYKPKLLSIPMCLCISPMIQIQKAFKQMTQKQEAIFPSLRILLYSSFSCCICWTTKISIHTSQREEDANISPMKWHKIQKHKAIKTKERQRTVIKRN